MITQERKREREREREDIVREKSHATGKGKKRDEK